MKDNSKKYQKPLKIDGELEDVLKASFKREQPTQMELTLQQAISVKDGYKHLEGQEVHVDGSDFIIDSLLVAPFDSKHRGEFIKRYEDVNSDADDITFSQFDDFWILHSACEI